MQEIIINTSTTAAKEVIFATFDTSGSAAVVTSLSVGDLLWRIPNAGFVTAAGTVSLIGSNIYHYLPTQTEVSVPGRAILTMSKANYARAYEMINIRGPAVNIAPIYSEAVVSSTGTRIPFRMQALSRACLPRGSPSLRPKYGSPLPLAPTLRQAAVSRLLAMVTTPTS